MADKKNQITKADFTNDEVKEAEETEQQAREEEQ
eukprot:g40788.t1